MARHACNMCRSSGTVREIVKGERYMREWPCPSCDGKGYHEREDYSSAHIRFPWDRNQDEAE